MGCCCCCLLLLFVVVVVVVVVVVGVVVVVFVWCGPYSMGSNWKSRLKTVNRFKLQMSLKCLCWNFLRPDYRRRTTNPYKLNC